MTEIILILGGLYMIGKLLSFSNKVSEDFNGTYNTVLSAHFQIILLRLKIFGATFLFVCIMILVLMIKLDIQWPSMKAGNLFSTSMISSEDKKEESSFSFGNIFNTVTEKKYKGGDIYMFNGKPYKLVDQETYRLDNLEGYPEVKLGGKKFWLVKPSI